MTIPLEKIFDIPFSSLGEPHQGERQKALKDKILSKKEALSLPPYQESNVREEPLDFTGQQALIENHSLIDPSLPASPLDPQILKALWHLQADVLISQTKYEKQTRPHHVAELFLSLLETVQWTHIPDSIKQLFAKHVTLNTLLKQTKMSDDTEWMLTQEVFNLSINESLLVASGRERREIFHPLFFKFTRVSEFCFDLLLYQPGKEKSYLRHEKKHELAHKNNSVRYYKNIPQKELFGADSLQDSYPDFFLTLLQNETPSSCASLPTFHAQNLLGHLQNYLIPRQHPDWPQTPDGPLTSQISQGRSHNDAMRGLQEVLRSHVSREDYKRILLEMRLHGLVRTYQAAKDLLADKGDETDQICRLLKESASGLLRDLASYHKQEIALSRDFSSAVRATALDVLERLKAAEKARAQSISNENTLIPEYFFPFERMKTEEMEKTSSLCNTLTTKLEPLPIQQHEVAIRDIRAQKPPLKATSFPKWIKQFVKGYRRSPPLEAALRVTEIGHLVASLPIPSLKPETGEETLWDQLAIEQLPQVITALNTLLESYERDTRHPKHYCSNTQIHTVLSLYAILTHLTLRLNQTSSYGRFFQAETFWSPSFEDLIDIGMIMTSPQEYERLQELIRFFTELGTSSQNDEPSDPDKRILFSFETPTYLLDHLEDFVNAFPELNSYCPHLTDPDQSFLKARYLATALFNDWALIPSETPALRWQDLQLPQMQTLARAACVAQLFTRRSRFRKEDGGLETACTWNVSPVVDLNAVQHTPSRVIYKMRRCNEYKHKWWILSSDDYLERSKTNLNHYLNNHYPLTSATLNLAHTQEIDPCQRLCFCAEANILSKEFFKNYTEPFSSDFLRAGVEDNLSPYKVLEYFLNHMELLEKPEWQTLFDIVFWRGVPGLDDNWAPKELLFPTAQELKQPALKKLAYRLILTGIERYFTNRSKKRPQVATVVFFLRLSSRLHRFLNEECVDTLVLLRQMLTTQDLNAQEKSALSLEVMIGYCHSGKKQLEPEELKELFSAWVIYKSMPLDLPWQSFLLEEQATYFIHLQSRYLQRYCLDTCRTLLENCLSQMGLSHLPKEATISLQGTRLQATYQRSFWELNLLSGQLLTETGGMNLTTSPTDFYKSEIYQYLFGEKEFQFFQSNGVYFFSDPLWGLLRAWKGKDNIYIIERQIDGCWYQYFSPSTLTRENKIPRALVAGYTHWLHTDPTAASYKDSRLLIFSHPENTVFIRATQEGRLLSADGNNAYWSIGISLDYPEILSHFEKQQYLLLVEDLQTHTTDLSFPRFSTPDVSLTFKVHTKGFNKGCLIYSNNNRYSVGEQTQGLLGTTQEYILLTPTQGLNEEKRPLKLLVPGKPITKYQPLLSRQPLDIEETWISASSYYFLTGEDYSKCTGRFRFYEYDVKEDKSLLPLSQEGSSFLAYLYFAQGRYEEALALLKKIHVKDQISYETEQHLLWITQIVENAEIDLFGNTKRRDPHDCTPEAAAVALFVWVFFKKLEKRARMEGNPRFYKAVCKRALKIYARNKRRISHSLHLSSEDEYRLPAAFSTYITQESRDFVSEDFISPIYRIPFSSIPDLPYPEAGFDSQGHADSNRNHAERYTNLFNTHPFSLDDEEKKELLEKPYDWRSVFIDCYQIAKTGSERDRRRLAFRLQLVGDPYRETTDLFEVSNEWCYLAFALVHPDKAPDLPANRNNIQSRWEFVKALSESMVAHQHLFSSKKIYQKWSSALKELPPPPLHTQPLPFKTLPSTISPTEKMRYYHDKIDENFPSRLLETYFQEKKEDPNSQQTLFLPEDLPLGFLGEEDPKHHPFASVLSHEYKNFVADYQAGVKISNDRLVYTLKGNLSLLRKDLHKESNTLETSLTQFKELILDFANRQPPEDVSNTLLTEAQVVTKFSMERLIGLYMKNDKEAFAEANPGLRGHLRQVLVQSYNLEDNPSLAIDYLCHLLTLYMMMQVHANRLKRARKWADKIYQLRRSSPNTKKEQAFIQALVDELTLPKTAIYSVYEEPYLLFFEYLSGFSVRKEQAEKLRNLLALDETNPTEYKNLIEQFIMGGGKTAFIAVVCVFLAAKKKRLAIFMTIASQYPSVRANLGNALKNYFDRDFEEIDICREKLTPKLCKSIKKRLRGARKRGDFLIVTPETVQGLCLSFLDLIVQACTEDTPHPQELMPQINTLRRILLFLKQHGDVLIDEVDLVLNILEEVNYPLGTPSYVPKPELELYRLFLTTLTDPAAVINEKGETIDLKNPIGLLEDRQTLVSKKQLFALAKRAIAWTLSQHAPLKFQEDALHGQVHKTLYAFLSEAGKKVFDRWVQLNETENIAEEDVTYRDGLKPLCFEEQQDLRLLQSSYLLSCSSQRQAALQESFLRYLSGEMNIKLQQLVDFHKKKKLDAHCLTEEENKRYYLLLSCLSSQDLQDGYFLIYLFELSIDKQTEEAADLIALSKHLFQDVLASILEKIYKFHFGKQNFQRGFTQEEFNAIAAKCLAAASNEAERRGLKNNECNLTYVYSEFKVISGGVLLTELNDPKKAEQACAYINSHEEAKKRFAKYLCLVQTRTPGQVVPYLAVDTPSDNRFGYAPEACFFLFIAMSQGFTPEELKRVGEHLQAKAQGELSRLRCDFDMTPTAIRFQQLSEGISLQELDTPEKLAQALTNLNANPHALLELATVLAQEHVTFYEKRLSGTGMQLTGLFNTVRGMSGTPWNVACFHNKLRFHLSLGTEGQIAHKLIERICQQKGYKHVHKVTALNQGEILKSLPDNLSKEERAQKSRTLRYEKLCSLIEGLLVNHPKKDRVKLLIDSGALFKEFSNEEVARALSSVLNMPVLFFTRNKAKQEKSPNTLAVIKPKINGKELIGGTRAEDIEKVGLNGGDYFVFMDQAHTTGTDIPLEPDCIGLMTLNETLLRRSFFQAALRLRRVLLEQEIEFVIPEHIIPNLVPFDHPDEQVSLILRVLLNSVKNQAIALANHYFRSRKQQIDAVFREILLRELERDKLSLRKLRALFEPFRKLTIIKQKAGAYALHGSLKQSVPSMTALEAYAKERLALYEGTDLALKQEMEEKIKDILEDARLSPYLPASVPDEGGAVFGLEVSIQTQVQAQVQTQQKVNLEIDQKIIDELGEYRHHRPGTLSPEHTWADSEIEQLIDYLRNTKTPSPKDNRGVTPLTTLLQKNQGSFRYRRDYSGVFQTPIYVTKSWIYATHKSLPVFHAMQRPLDQIFLVKTDDQLLALALAEREAQEFKQYLDAHPTRGVWLLQPCGALFHSLPHADALEKNPLPETLLLKQILLECHVFNGTISYLADHPTLTVEWLQGDLSLPLDQQELARHTKLYFLKLKVIGKTSETLQLLTNPVFQEHCYQVSTLADIKSQQMQEWGSLEIQAIREKEDPLFSLLSMDQLNCYLHPSQVCLLPKKRLYLLRRKRLVQQVAQEDIDELTPLQMQWIKEEQIPWIKKRACIQRLSLRYCASMTEEQFQQLHPSQIQALREPSQVERLLQYPELIAYIDRAQVEAGLIDKRFLPFLKDPDSLLAFLALYPAEKISPSAETHQAVLILNKETIAGLDPKEQKDQELLANLQWYQVNWLTSETQLLCLNAGQIGSLSKKTIQRLVRSSKMIRRLHLYQINDLHEAAMKRIPRSKVAVLTQPSLIRCLPKKYRSLLTAEQFRQLHITWKEDGREKYGNIDMAIYRQLSTSAKKLLNEDDFGHLAGFMDPSQIEEKELLYQLKPSDYKYLESEAQLRLLLFAPKGYIRDDIRNSPLSENLLKNLRSRDVIQTLTNKEHIGRLNLNSNVLQHLTAQQIPLFNPLYLGYIPNAELFEFVTREQIVDADRYWRLRIQELNTASDQLAYKRFFYHIYHGPNPRRKKLLKQTTLNMVHNLTPEDIKAFKDLELITEEAPPLIQITSPSAQIEISSSFSEVDTESSAMVERIFEPPPEIIEKQELSQELSEDGLIKQVLLILAGLASLGLVLVGALALLGAYAPFAPQFAIALYQFCSPLLVACFFTATGTVLCVGLITLAVLEIHDENRWREEGNGQLSDEVRQRRVRIAFAVAGAFISLAILALGLIGLLGTQTHALPHWFPETFPIVKSASLSVILGAGSLSCILFYMLYQHHPA